jgi:hypothetical protein
MMSIAYWLRLLPAVRAKLHDQPGVVGVGLGTRERARQFDPPVWRIYVSRQAHTDSLTLGAPLPKEIFGLATQVLRATPGCGTAAPVYTAGMEIQTYVPSVFTEDPHGSIGCFALDSNGKPVLLTCSHVLFPGFHAFPGLAVDQPDYSTTGGGDRIATPVFDPSQIQGGLYKGGFKLALGDVQVPSPGPGGYTTLRNQTCSKTDCAIASLDANPIARFRNVWTTSGGEIAIGGVNTDVVNTIPYTPAGTTPQAESYVRVFSPGRKTLIYGTLIWIKTHVGDPDGMKFANENDLWRTPFFHFGVSESPKKDEEAGILPSLDHFLILPRPAPIAGQADYTQFYTQQPKPVLNFVEGDSGTVVIDYQGRVIAQMSRKLSLKVDQFLKDPAQRTLVEFTSIGNFGVASPIEGVLEQLNITIPAHFDQAGPTCGPALDVRAFTSERTAEKLTCARLRRELLESTRGRLLLGKVREHYKEVQRMLTKFRVVALAWRNLQGSAWYYEALKNARDPKHRIPTMINGVSREELFTTMTRLVMRYGSPELRHAVERHARWAVPTLLQVTTLDDVPKLLARRKSNA